VEAPAILELPSVLWLLEVRAMTHARSGKNLMLQFAWRFVPITVLGMLLVIAPRAAAKSRVPILSQSAPQSSHVRGGTETMLYTFQGGMDGAGPSGGLIFDEMGALYGTTTSGGGYGTAFKLLPQGSGYAESVLHRFQNRRREGAVPVGGLIADVTGVLYGATRSGGAYRGGTV
jgi:hypothetical protein